MEELYILDLYHILDNIGTYLENIRTPNSISKYLQICLIFQYFQDILQIQDLQEISKIGLLYTFANYIGIFTKVSDEFGQVTECPLAPPLHTI